MATLSMLRILFYIIVQSILLSKLNSLNINFLEVSCKNKCFEWKLLKNGRINEETNTIVKTHENDTNTSNWPSLFKLRLRNRYFIGKNK